MSRTILALLFLAGCPTKNDEASAPYCSDTSTEIAVDEVTAVGFAAAEVLAALPVSESTELQYVDASTTSLDIAFTPGTTYRFVDSEPVYPDSGMMLDMDVSCPDRVEIDGSLHFFTGDGAFAEDLPVTLVAPTLDELTIHADLDLSGLAGTFDIVPFVQSPDYDELSAYIAVVFNAGVSLGEVAGQASGEDECEEGDSCSAWAEMVAVGTWPSAE